MFPPCSSFVSTHSLRVLIFHLLFYHVILKMQVKYVKKETYCKECGGLVYVGEINDEKRK